MLGGGALGAVELQRAAVDVHPGGADRRGGVRAGRSIAWWKAIAAWAKNVGVLMLTVVSRNCSAKNGKPNRAAEHDIGLAAGNMVLQATALGLQGHQMIGIEPAKVRATYKVPDAHEPLTAIALGYPAAVQPGTTDPLGQRDLTPRARKSLSEIVISGAWGQPAKLVVTRESGHIMSQKPEVLLTAAKFRVVPRDDHDRRRPEEDARDRPPSGRVRDRAAAWTTAASA